MQIIRLCKISVLPCPAGHHYTPAQRVVGSRWKGTAKCSRGWQKMCVHQLPFWSSGTEVTAQLLYVPRAAIMCNIIEVALAPPSHVCYNDTGQSVTPVVSVTGAALLIISRQWTKTPLSFVMQPIKLGSIQYARALQMYGYTCQPLPLPLQCVQHICTISCRRTYLLCIRRRSKNSRLPGQPDCRTIYHSLVI